MSMFEMSDEQAAEWRQQLHDLVASDVNGEEVLCAAAFRRGGATASMVASKAQLGGIVYAGIKMLNKKKAGGLPERVVLAVTPDKLYAFNLGFKGRAYRNKGEAAVWDRPGLKISTAPASGMTALTIESPTEGEKTTLVGIGVKDDPVSQELIGVLQGQAPAAG
ncbi:MAG TPA: hypothetical protein VNB59_02945 [Solirubrobacterales bacterium]|jgi:hypothetical protein|nr:hypothetical protein [Solirubrobacterales bacterium]